MRYPGGNSASIVAEVRAQAAAGLSTVLIHVPSPHLRHARPFQSRIVECLRDGLADLAHDDGTEVAARVLLIRQPRIFTDEPAVVPKVKAGHTIVVLNQPPGDESHDQRYYVFDEVRARVTRLFGDGIVWAPISPQVRDNVQRVAPRAPLPDTDWHEIIDIDDWAAAVRTPGDVPVIGRHGRPDEVKWPREAGELLQAYPDSAEVKVRILGGGEIGVRRLGHQPQNWDVVEFGAESPQDFLAGLDFFVYFHDPDWTEAFGRTILEAMASGVPVIVGPHFRSIFGDAALYTDPAGVRDLVRRLHADRAAYQAQVERARRYVTEQFGSASHIARLASLGVMPRPGRRRTRPPVRPSRPNRRVLLVGDDVARFRAIARRLPAGLEAVVVAGSAGLAGAHAAGLLTEYLPGATELGAPPARWNDFARDRLGHLVELYRPRAVLVGGLPQDGIVAAVEEHPLPRWLWLRPAMWRRGTGGEWAARGAVFGGILEPGEFAAGGDEGWTTTARSGVSTVDPITGLPDRLVRRDGDDTLLCRGVDAALPGFRAIEAGPAELGEVTVAVSRADYMNFHELIGARVPTVFVPDPDACDDELARARFAAAAGVALYATDDETAATALEELADPAVRTALTRRCAELAFGNGAEDAANWLAAHCREVNRAGHR
ncbi:glycosyltransferase involved in cell wall biosynthesis [Actinoplanes tereljensis]|uniref:glycosyltransferase n=1 Tax=Paractinoplanes tereljensis TaxID=571912 RepID=UPI001EF18B65|nr:glycosyltransferase [Actinoplanes tereljensis]